MTVEQSSSSDTSFGAVARLIYSEWLGHWRDFFGALVLRAKGAEARRALDAIMSEDDASADLTAIGHLWNDDSRFGQWIARAGLSSPAAVGVEMPETLVLRSTLEMPRASRRDLGRALTHELERVCPLPAAEIYFDFTARASLGGTAQVDLRIVRRKTLDDAGARLLQHNIRIGSVFFAGDDTEADWLALPVDKIGRLLVLWQRHLVAILGFTAAFLLLICLIAAYGRGTAKLDAINNQLWDGERQALGARHLHHEAAVIARELKYIDSRKALQSSETIAELSRVVPNGTWVDSLAISGASVRIQGTSSRASDLIALIDGSSLLHNAQFAAPVTKAEDGSEQFVITFDRRGP